MQHEDRKAYRKRFSSDVRTLCKSMSINPFTQDKLVTLNCSEVIPDVAFTTLKKMKDIGEKQLVDFIKDRLIYSKVSVCETVPKNEFCIWHAPKLDSEKPFTPSNSEITKMRSACELRSDLATTIFNQKILNVPQS